MSSFLSLSFFHFPLSVGSRDAREGKRMMFGRGVASRDWALGSMRDVFSGVASYVCFECICDLCIL
jgi:hypothetical protein